jgi:acyl-CoA thioester hydrolase
VGAFVTQVPMRWTDVDPYQHLNHARAVTIMEEARIALFFHDAVTRGVETFAAGMFVVSLQVDYKRQVTYRSRTLRVVLTITDVRAAWFSIDYALHAGDGEADPVAVLGRTKMAMYDAAAGLPRRIDGTERDFLEGYRA